MLKIRFTVTPLIPAMIILSLGCCCVKAAQTFESRRDDAFEALKGRKFVAAPLDKPLGEGRPRYTRGYSFSVINFAMAAFWNNEQIDVANLELAKHCKFYLDNPAERNDRDNLHWVSNQMGRIVEFYGQKGSVRPLLNRRTESMMYELMSAYLEDSAYMEDTQRPPLHIGIWQKWLDDPSIPVPPTSENHHLMKFTTIWLFGKLLADNPEYAKRQYHGHTAKAHFEAWDDYAKKYLRQRGTRGLFIEIANGGYGPRSLETIYTLYDFGDEQMRKLAGNLITLYWASWAQEQIDGVRGGAKTRIQQHYHDRVAEDSVLRLAYFYTGMGAPVTPGQEMFTVLTSEYRLPKVVADIALNTAARGQYEAYDRRLGLLEDHQNWSVGFRMREDFGGILRYSWCAPEFIMGMSITEARSFMDWSIMTAQNAWCGVIFSGHPDARIVPQARAVDHKRTDNAMWGVQKKGTMLIQRLPLKFTRFLPDPKDKNVPITHGTRVWFSEVGLSNYIEKDGWVFVESQGAYAAVRPARGIYGWTASEDKLKGKWLAMHDWFSPVIIEVARKADYAGYAAFQAAVLRLPLTWNGDTLSYMGVYGDKFTFDAADTPKFTTINGITVDKAFLSPEYLFHSPFINSKWDSGIFEIGFKDEKVVLDFN